MNNDTLWDREYPTEDEILEQENSLYEDEVEEEYDDEFYEDFIEEYDESEEINTVNEAHVRLEQGRLYNMLINHNLFEGVDADPTAIGNVQKQLKGFILEKLEEMLGMRAKKEVEVHKIESQFNDMEVKALKMVASKVTQGQSAKAPEPKKESSPLAPVQKKQEKPKGLNTFNKKPTKAAAPAPKPKRKRPQQKVKKKLKKEIAEVSTKNMSAEEIAMKDIKYLETLKNMPLEKKAEIVAERHKRPKVKSTIAGAGSEQQAQDIINSHYQTKTSINQEANHWMDLLKKAGKL